MNSLLSGFSQRLRPVSFITKELKLMFAFDRSALAVLLPLALLLAVVLFSRLGESDPQPMAQSEGAHPTEAAHQDHTVAANLPSR
jgi:hypothetical protein